MPGFYDTILVQYTEYLFVIPGAARATPMVGSLFGNQNMPVRGLNPKKSSKH
jgi:hypothetical protein